MNLPPHSWRTKPTSCLLTLRLSRGRPPARKGPLHDPREGQTSSAQELGTRAHMLFLETCLARVEVFVLFSIRKEKKGNALWPQDVFSACGHLNADYEKEENDNQKGHDLPLRCLQGHYSGFVLKMLCRLLQKVQQWAGRKASTRHWRHPRATHTHTLKRTPGLPSLPGQLINRKQSYLLAPRSRLVKGKDRHPGPAVLSLLSSDRPLNQQTSNTTEVRPSPTCTQHREALWTSTLGNTQGWGTTKGKASQ